APLSSPPVWPASAWSCRAWSFAPRRARRRSPAQARWPPDTVRLSRSISGKRRRRAKRRLLAFVQLVRLGAVFGVALVHLGHHVLAAAVLHGRHLTHLRMVHLAYVHG